jgi:hypothetical protein
MLRLQMLVLYVLGGLAGSVTHLAYCWYDAGGERYTAAGTTNRVHTMFEAAVNGPQCRDCSKILLETPLALHASLISYGCRLVCLVVAGPEFGLKYAVNTPGVLGCSGAVAAITAYKTALQPMGLPGIGFPLPLPIAVIGFLYCCMYIREQVSRACRQ